MSSLISDLIHFLFNDGVMVINNYLNVSVHWIVYENFFRVHSHVTIFQADFRRRLIFGKYEQ